MRGALAALVLLAGAAAAEVPAPEPGSVRVATFNVSLFRKGAGLALQDIGKDGPQVAALAEIVQAVRPDVLVLNELDHDPEGRALAALAAAFAAGRGGREGVDYPHRFAGPVNTGEPSGLDLDGDGSRTGPNDAFGFGRFPGQYGMAVLSRLPLDPGGLRSFRLMRWADLPGAEQPRRADGTPFPSAEAAALMRLSSKAHWDLPVLFAGGVAVSLLLSHPTPPVFDDAHDLNGHRNRDEILFWVRYLDGAALTDDAGRTAPRAERPFVLAGDLNADPEDGDGRKEGIRALLAHPLLRDPAPVAPGGREQAMVGVNAAHAGDPARDTADFDDRRGPGNLRADYVLPARVFRVTGAGVFWPAAADPLHRLVGTGRPVSSDHRLVWVDIALP